MRNLASRSYLAIDWQHGINRFQSIFVFSFPSRYFTVPLLRQEISKVSPYSNYFKLTNFLCFIHTTVEYDIFKTCCILLPTFICLFLSFPYKITGSSTLVELELLSGTSFLTALTIQVSYENFSPKKKQTFNFGVNCPFLKCDWDR